MNKQQLFTAGGLLLATTALTSAANAGIISNTVTQGAAFGGSAVTPVLVANTIFSTTASSANSVSIGPKSYTVAFSNNFNGSTKFSVELDPIGASFVNSVDVSILLANAGSFSTASFTVSATGNCTSVTALTTKIILDGCGGINNKISATNGANSNTSVSYAGVLFSGISFNNASALATAGSVIALNGLVYNANNNTQNFETITQATVITSAAPITASVVGGGTATANASATPVAFAYFTTGTAATSLLSTTLANIDISSTGALAQDLVT